MIVIEKLFKSFNGSNVLTDISTKFEKGKTNLIIGQSGSGKTVLLKCILGLYGIDTGNIFFEEYSFQKMETKERSIYTLEQSLQKFGVNLSQGQRVRQLINQLIGTKYVPSPVIVKN